LFDWLTENDTNFLKVLEGRYADKSKELQKAKEAAYFENQRWVREANGNV
jgi:hypothetical protein